MAVQGPYPDTGTGEAIESLAAGGRIVDVLHATATLDFGSIAANLAADLDVTVPGARANDICLVGPPFAPDAAISFTAFVESADTVTVRAANNSIGAVDPASATYRVIVFKFAEGV